MPEATDKQIEKIEKDVYVSLREYFEALMREQQRSIERQMSDADEDLERHIKEQIEQLRSVIKAQSELVNQAYNSAQAAIAKAETATEKRFEGVNEFRQTLSDQATKFLPRDEYSARHEALEKEIQVMSDERISPAETQIARLYGGLAVVAFIGVANLIKIWFAH